MRDQQRNELPPMPVYNEKGELQHYTTIVQMPNKKKKSFLGNMIKFIIIGGLITIILSAAVIYGYWKADPYGYQQRQEQLRQLEKSISQKQDSSESSTQSQDNAQEQRQEPKQSGTYVDQNGVSYSQDEAWTQILNVNPIQYDGSWFVAARCDEIDASMSADSATVKKWANYHDIQIGSRPDFVMTEGGMPVLYSNDYAEGTQLRLPNGEVGIVAHKDFPAKGIAPAGDHKVYVLTYYVSQGIK